MMVSSVLIGKGLEIRRLERTGGLPLGCPHESGQFTELVDPWYN